MKAYIVHVSFLLIVGMTTMQVQVGVACVHTVAVVPLFPGYNKIHIIILSHDILGCS